MKLNPLHDNLFIEREKQVEKCTPGGVLMPADAQLKPDTAKVIAVGPGRVLPNGETVTPTVEPGDTILIGRFSGTEVNWETEKRVVIPWGDVLGVVDLEEHEKKSE